MKYEKSPVFEERKTLSMQTINNDSNDGLWQQGVHLSSDALKDFDDWNIISDSSTKVRIKQFTIYADYYICAFEIVYIDKNGKETKSIHAIDPSYLSRSNIVKKSLDIDEDDYIEYINCAYSSQKTFIRLIRIATRK